MLSAKGLGGTEFLPDMGRRPRKASWKRWLCFELSLEVEERREKAGSL